MLLEHFFPVSKSRDTCDHVQSDGHLIEQIPDGVPIIRADKMFALAFPALQLT